MYIPVSTWSSTDSKALVTVCGRGWNKNANNGAGTEQAKKDYPDRGASVMGVRSIV